MMALEREIVPGFDLGCSRLPPWLEGDTLSRYGC